MTAPSEAAALTALKRKQGRYLEAESKAANLKGDRDREVLAVREQYGTGYQALAEALGLTKDRVAQVLGEQRRARANPTP